MSDAGIEKHQQPASFSKNCELRDITYSLSYIAAPPDEQDEKFYIDLQSDDLAVEDMPSHTLPVDSNELN